MILRREFKWGEVLFNFRLKLFPWKLKSRWLGPFIVYKVFPFGVLKLSSKVDYGQRLKHCCGRNLSLRINLEPHQRQANDDKRFLGGNYLNFSFNTFVLILTLFFWLYFSNLKFGDEGMMGFKKKKLIMIREVEPTMKCRKAKYSIHTLSPSPIFLIENPPNPTSNDVLFFPLSHKKNP